MKILEFNTQIEADAALATFNEIAAAWWQTQGYTVLAGQLIGKNVATGKDEPNKTKTVTWDVVKESPDGTFYFTSPVNDPRFVDWREYLPPGVMMPEDQEMPEAWETVPEAWETVPEEKNKMSNSSISQQGEIT